MLMNKYLKELLFLLCASFFGAYVQAAPVHLETDAASIILVRPIDMWTGDAGRMERMREAYSNHLAGFNIFTANNKVITAAPGLFGSFSNDPIVQAVRDELSKKGFKLKGNQAAAFNLMKPITLSSNEISKILELQSRFFTASVLAFGDPRLLENKVLGQKVLGNILGLLTLGVPLARAGTVAATGAKIGVESFTPDQAAALPKEVWKAVVPIEIPAFDFTPYRTVDIIKVQISPDLMGQLIIAYKGEHTQEAENEALIKAIVSLTGADTTLEAIQKARSDDLAKRQAIWDACVAERRQECQVAEDANPTGRSR